MTLRMRNFRSAFLVLAVLALGGCATTSALDREVAREPVPTAMFVFFDPESVVPVEGSDAVFDRAAAVLRVFDNIGVRLVGHRAADEAASVDGAGLDEARLGVLAAQMERRGVSGKVISRLAQGTQENMAPAAGGDHSVDRRGEMIFGVLPTRRD